MDSDLMDELKDILIRVVETEPVVDDAEYGKRTCVYCWYTGDDNVTYETHESTCTWVRAKKVMERLKELEGKDRVLLYGC